MKLSQLTEEHNTSLMYHKLFPNTRLLRDLEAKGYKFEMGGGLKLQRRFFSSTHRNSSGGPRRQRMIQSLIILKNGKFFREIPKAAWVQLVDPSDKDSKTYGEVFMRKLLDHEIEQYKQREQALLASRNANG